MSYYLTDMSFYMKEFILTPETSKASRSLLGLSQKQLAEKADVAISTIADFERGTRSLLKNNEKSVVETFNSLGIRFKDDGSIGLALTLAFLTKNRNFEIIIAYGLDTDNTGILEVLSIFGDTSGNEIAIPPIQQATNALKHSIDKLVGGHVGKKAPQLRHLSKAIGDLEDDEYFFLLPETPKSTKEKFEYELLIDRLNKGIENKDTDSDKFGREIFGDLMDKYNIHPLDTNRKNGLSIGNSRKADRTCRFCHRMQKDGASFKKKAHAISSALGNQFVKLNEECDECNEYFGRKVEPHLVEMLAIQRAFLGTTSRGKIPKLKFSNGQVLSREDGLVVISSQDIQKDENGALKCSLTSSYNLIPVNAYRALAKIALSVISKENLPSLRNTVKWVREGDDNGARLPEIATNIVYLAPEDSAQITLYIRKEASGTLPHVVCEFRLGCYIYVYTLPFSEKDSDSLVGFFEREEFKTVFKHYNAVEGWKLEDLSSRKVYRPTFNINTHKRAD